VARCLIIVVLALVAVCLPLGQPGAVPSGCAGAPPECIALGGFTGDTFTLAAWTGSASNNPNTFLRHCVFSNAPTAATPKNYDVTVTGTGTPGGAFLLSGPGGDLPYEVALNDNQPNSFVVVTAGVPSNFDALTEAVYNTCTNAAASNNGQRLRVRVFGADMQAFAAGIYTGTLDMLVQSPDTTSSVTQTSGTITVTIPSYVRLVRFNNINFGTWNPNTVPASLTRFDSTVCVWSNHSSKDYTVTATTGTGAFELTGTPGSIPMEVWWAQSAGVTTVAGADAQLAYNSPATFTSTTSDVNCGGGSTASVVVFLSEGALSAVTAGSFTASLTMSIGLAP